MTINKFEISPTVTEAVQEMNSVAGSIGFHSELLEDISSKLFQVVEDMNTAVHNETQDLYYREHHHELRMLASLMHYTMKDVQQDTENIKSIGETLFEEIVRNKKKPLARECEKASK